MDENIKNENIFLEVVTSNKLDDRINYHFFTL